jgi:type IV secretory pathway ATPase VirB11/archaellum biosynthesis ATPase
MLDGQKRRRVADIPEMHVGGKAGPYSIITIHIETDKGIIERVFDEGFRGPNALEEATAYLTSHLTLSDLILQSVLKLQKHLKEQNK